MEKFLASAVGRRGSDPTAAAQDVMYDAWDQTSRKKRIALARKALAVSPLCADAYVLLAEEEATSVKQALALYEKGVEAGELALGPEQFDEYAGHFWGFLETRPYMRARAGLAEALWATDRHGEAIEHYLAMLELNPNDNQGIRHILAGRLLAQGDIPELKKLIAQYEEDGSTEWLYTRTLLAFLERDPGADKLAAQAFLTNSHVPAMLSSRKPIVSSRNDYITMGSEEEAAYYVEECGSTWSATPGAIDWLIELTKTLKPPRRGRAQSH
ncbi:MAG: hypothetical protein GY798_01115 [Hyphomicrobiales bacterium]|nr:hypothetical protein [Hyphomicrobiales bacterium]